LTYATQEQLSTLIPPAEKKLVRAGAIWRDGAKGLTNRLGKLVRHNYLIKVGYPYRKTTEPPVYSLDEKACSALAQERGVDPDEMIKKVDNIHKYLKTTTNKHYAIEHRLGINNFYIVLSLAMRNNKRIKFTEDEEGIFWTENESAGFKAKIKDMPPVVKNKILSKYPRDNRHLIVTEDLYRKPDAIFCLDIDGQRVGFLFELDIGSQGSGEVATKLYCYYKWWKDKEKVKKQFGTNHLRVLFVIKNTKVMRNSRIKKSALPITNGHGSGLFWFTTQDHIDIHNPRKVLDPIWTVGHKNHLEELHNLLDKNYAYKKPYNLYGFSIFLYGSIPPN
jgi:hypothetical protein